MWCGLDNLAAQLVNAARRWKKDDGGSIAVIFALVLIPVIGATGAAVDYSRANGVKTNLQGALDAAVLAGLTDDATIRDTRASNTFNSVFVSKVSGTTVGTLQFTTNNDGTYSGSVSIRVPTAFMGILGVNTLTVSANAKARIGSTQSVAKAMCIISLNTSIAKAVAMSGSAAINAPTCLLQVNSNNTDAVDMSGSTTIKTAENCFVGKLKAYSSGAVTPSPDVVCNVLTDPFAGMAMPTVGACNHTKLQVNTSTTLQPGVYCQGLTISSTTVTLAPGLYIISGTFTASGSSKITGDGVTIFLTGDGAGVTSSGGTSWHLVAAGKLGYACSGGSTSCLAGFAFFLDPSGKQLSKSVLSGGSEMYFEGGLYFPQQQLELSGGSGNYSLSPFTAIAADTFNLSSSSAINLNSDPSKTSVPVPSGFLGSMGGSLALVQ